jgi:hypothetical protein
MTGPIYRLTGTKPDGTPTEATLRNDQGQADAVRDVWYQRGLTDIDVTVTPRDTRR